MTDFLIDGALKASAIAFLGLTVVALLKAQSAALRHWVLALAVGSALGVPALSLVVPSWATRPLWHTRSAPVRVQGSVNDRTANQAQPNGEPSLPIAVTQGGMAVRAGIGWSRVLWTVWLG